MEQFRADPKKAAEAPAYGVGEVEFDAVFNPKDESAEQAGGFLSLVEDIQSSTTSLRERKVYTEDDFIYEDVLLIAADFLEASNGKDITQEDYRYLLANEWAQYDIEEILRIFHGEWSLFQADARHYHDTERLQQEKPRGWKKHLLQLHEASKQLLYVVYDPEEIVNNLLNSDNTKPLPKYYYDLSTGKVLVGDKSLEKHILSGNNPDDIKRLDEVLTDTNIPLNTKKRRRAEVKDWQDPEKCRKYGRFISELVTDPDHPDRRHLNRALIRRAYRLGLGPSVWVIKSALGNLSAFYNESGAANTYRRNGEGLTLVDLIKYTRRIGEEKGTRPDESDFIERAKADPSNPTIGMIYEKIRPLGGGGINRLLQLSGYFVPDLLDNDGYVEWGVEFMRANDGIVPTVPMLAYLSSIKVGPSAAPIAEKFTSIKQFQEEVRRQYEEQDKNSNEVSPNNETANTFPKLYLPQLKLDYQYSVYKAARLQKKREINNRSRKKVGKRKNRNKVSA